MSVQAPNHTTEALQARRQTLGHRELGWVLAWAILVMLLTCVPYWHAQKLANGRVFSGFIWGVDEGNVYLTWMRQAGEGSVFFRNQYAVAPETPRFLNLFLQLGGRLSESLHLPGPPIAIWHALRLCGGVFLLVSFYLLAARVTQDRVARWAALALASVGSGLGWLIVLNWPLSGIHPVDVGQAWQVQPEAVTFPSLLLNGLFTTSMALMCLTFLYTIRAVCDDDRKAVWWAGLCLLILGNIHTYDVFAVWLALGAWVVVIGISTCSCQRAFGKVLAIAAGGLPSVAWAMYATFADPAFLAKGLTPTPAFRLVDYVVAYGLIGLLAVVGTILVLRKKASGGTAPLAGLVNAESGEELNTSSAADKSVLSSSWQQITPADTSTRSTVALDSPAWLMLIWVVATALLLLVPVSFQRKMIEGLHLPLCLLAGIAVSWLASAITSGLRRRGKHRQAMERVVLTVCAIMVFCIPSNALFVSLCLQNVKTNNTELFKVLQPPLYLDAPEAEAMKWLSHSTGASDVIMSTSLMGSYIPTYCPAKVWVGHWAETLHFQDRLRDVDWTYSELPPEQLRQGLQERGVTLVFYSPYEQALGRGNSEAWVQAANKGLQKVYGQNGVSIYRVPQER